MYNKNTSDKRVYSAGLFATTAARRLFRDVVPPHGEFVVDDTISIFKGEVYA